MSNLTTLESNAFRSNLSEFYQNNNCLVDSINPTKNVLFLGYSPGTTNISRPPTLRSITKLGISSISEDRILYAFINISKNIEGFYRFTGRTFNSNITENFVGTNYRIYLNNYNTTIFEKNLSSFNTSTSNNISEPIFLKEGIYLLIISVSGAISNGFQLKYGFIKDYTINNWEWFQTLANVTDTSIRSRVGNQLTNSIDDLLLTNCNIFDNNNSHLLIENFLSSAYLYCSQGANINDNKCINFYNNLPNILTKFYESKLSSDYPNKLDGLYGNWSIPDTDWNAATLRNNCGPNTSRIRTRQYLPQLFGGVSNQVTPHISDSQININCYTEAEVRAVWESLGCTNPIIPNLSSLRLLPYQTDSANIKQELNKYSKIELSKKLNKSGPIPDLNIAHNNWLNKPVSTLLLINGDENNFVEKDIIYSNICYSNGYTWTSGNYRLIIQDDGNLVLYLITLNIWNKVWDSNTSKNPNARLCMQSNGDLVLYSTTGVILWNYSNNGILYTISNNINYYGKILDNGRLGIYNTNNIAVYGNQTNIIYPTINYYQFNWFNSGSNLRFSIEFSFGRLQLIGAKSTRLFPQTLPSANNNGFVRINLNTNKIEVINSTNTIIASYPSNDTNTTNIVFYMINLTKTGCSPILVGCDNKLQSLISLNTINNNNKNIYYNANNNELLEYQSGDEILFTGVANTFPSDIFNSNNICYSNNFQWANNYNLVIQSDGNLVIYKPGIMNISNTIWSSSTFGNSNARLILQEDGNLVIYKSSTSFIPSNTLWNSRTFGFLVNSAIISNTGYLILKTDANQLVWTYPDPIDSYIKQNPNIIMKDPINYIKLIVYGNFYKQEILKLVGWENRGGLANEYFDYARSIYPILSSFANKQISKFANKINFSILETFSNPQCDLTKISIDPNCNTDNLNLYKSYLTRMNSYCKDGNQIVNDMCFNYANQKLSLSDGTPLIIDKTNKMELITKLENQCGINENWPNDKCISINIKNPEIIQKQINILQNSKNPKDQELYKSLGKNYGDELNYNECLINILEDKCQPYLTSNNKYKEKLLDVKNKTCLEENNINHNLCQDYNKTTPEQFKKLSNFCLKDKKNKNCRKFYNKYKDDNKFKQTDFSKEYTTDIWWETNGWWVYLLIVLSIIFALVGGRLIYKGRMKQKKILRIDINKTRRLNK